MSKLNNVFISWSGPRSRFVAEALKDWLPTILQAAKPWMSERDIGKGTQSLPEITKALDSMKVGISCLTPENLEAPWILFEAGALSKAFSDDRTRLCTYLLAGLQPQEVKGPLSMFQATRAEKEDTRKLILSVNAAISGDESLSETLVNTAFDRGWSDLESKLKNMPTAEKIVEAKRHPAEMVAEILELCRQYLPHLDEPPFPNLLRESTVTVADSGLDALAMARRINPLGSVRSYGTHWGAPLVQLPTKIYSVKLKNDEKIKMAEGTHTEELGAGTLIVFNGNVVVARFKDVETWWAEPPAT